MGEDGRGKDDKEEGIEEERWVRRKEGEEERIRWSEVQKRKGLLCRRRACLTRRILFSEISKLKSVLSVAIFCKQNHYIYLSPQQISIKILN